MKKWILLIFCSFLLTGCWNYRELNELAITTGIALDKIEDDFEITVLISNSKKTGSDNSKNQAATAVYSGKGKTIYEAFQDTAASVSKQIYLGHIEVFIVSEDVLKQDIINTVDFLFRYPQTRNEFQLIIAKDCKAGDVLKITTPLESFPSQNVFQNLRITSRLQGFIYSVNLNEFMRDLLEEGIDPVLPGVTIIGNVEEGNEDKNIEKNEPSTYLKLVPLGLFHKDKLVGWANQDESTGINILNNKINIFAIDSECGGGKTITEISAMKTSIEYKDHTTFKVKIKAIGELQEVTCPIDLEKSKNIEKIRQKNIDKMKYYIEQAFKLSQNLKADVIGFGRTIYKHNPEYWNRIKDNWENDLSDIQLEYEIDLKLEAKGKINNYIEVK